jgi:GH24 family phage-related lysozyme (muramidase)
MEMIKQLLLALGVMGSPVADPPEPCLSTCRPSPAAVGIIKHFEGYSPFVYEDAAGYPTIGFGHLIKRGERIKEPLLGEAAEKLLAQDVAPKVAAVNARVSVPLFQDQFDAVVSWTYNLGEGALKSSTMLKRLMLHGMRKFRRRSSAGTGPVAKSLRDWSAAGRRKRRCMKCVGIDSMT